MCQMCDEYENELVRMGLIEDAKKFREERHGEKPSDSARGDAKTERAPAPKAEQWAS